MTEMGAADFGGLGDPYQYGPIDQRSPAARNTIYCREGASDTNTASDAAKAFEFVAAAGSLPRTRVAPLGWVDWFEG